MLLLALTSITDFVGLCTALWLAGYLFSRGFRGPTTIRAVIILLLLSGSFIEGYISLHEPEKSHYAWYVAANLLAVLVWYNLTFQWLPPQLQRRLRWGALAIYAIGVLTIVGVLLPNSGLGGPGPGLIIGTSLPTLFIIGNAALLLPAAVATIVNFRLGARYGRGPGFRVMWLATLFGALAMPYGALSYLLGFSVPRLGLDLLVYAALLMLGLAVARHQAFVERRTTLQDLPVSALAIVTIMAFFAFATQQAGFSAAQTTLVTALAVATHSVYDIAREQLDRWLHRQESDLRHQLRKLARDVGGPDTLATNLQAGLNSLVLTLRANGGFVAVRQGDVFAVLASVHSLPVGQKLELSALASDDLRPGEGLVSQAAWLAPAQAGAEQLGALGLGPRANLGAYSDDDLDLLVEAADSVGLLLRADVQQAASRAQLMSLATEVERREVGLQAGAQDLIAALESQLDQNFERQVEQCLRHLSDYPLLGQSGLVADLLIDGATHIERGKAVRAALLRAIETLRPVGAEPTGTQSVPREWHAYTILHEAYVEDLPNRDIMARLYVSEGTFNRQRRKALHAVARALLEAKHPTVASDIEGLHRPDPAAGN
jgi:hypothetical protein